jgi:hypothetical protein
MARERGGEGGSRLAAPLATVPARGPCSMGENPGRNECTKKIGRSSRGRLVRGAYPSPRLPASPPPTRSRRAAQRTPPPLPPGRDKDGSLGGRACFSDEQGSNLPPAGGGAVVFLAWRSVPRFLFLIFFLFFAAFTQPVSSSASLRVSRDKAHPPSGPQRATNRSARVQAGSHIRVRGRKGSATWT